MKSYLMWKMANIRSGILGQGIIVGSIMFVNR